MRTEAQLWLEKTIKAILARDGEDTGESTVIVNHLAQMKSFGIRQGVELYPAQDSDRIRYKYIEKLYNENRIDLSLEHYWDLFLADGKLCWYLRPTGNSYRIYHFGGENFKANYSAAGDLEEVVIIYSYDVRPEVSISGGLPYVDKRWVRLIITKEKVVTETTQTKPEFYSPYNVALASISPSIGTYSAGGQSTRVESINTLGWIPCVITGNYVSTAGMEGRGEFEMVAQQLFRHNQMCEAIAENISFFGNPTLVTSRTMAEILDGGEAQRTTYSSGAGFSGSTPSTSRLSPEDRNAAARKIRIAKVIGNVQADERFGYIVPDPISPDQSRYVAEYRESIHAMLGGVDPLSISAGATAFEIKSLYGRSAATALKKARSIYKHGLCRVFEMAITAEEQLFKLSIAMAMNLAVEQLSDELVQELISQPTLPKELKNWQPQGLPPLGDRRVLWRWLGPVFEDSPLDLQQKSIVVRNLEEVGVETSSALKFLFPEKTESEIRAMLTGFPFREANQSAMALSQQINALQTLMTTPDPRTGQPIGVSLNNLPIIESILQHILKRLNYGISNEPAAPPGSWSSIPGGAELSASAPAAVQPASSPSVLPTGQPVPGSYGATSSAAAAGLAIPTFLPSRGPIGGTVEPAYPGGLQPDYAAQLPIPGSRVSATNVASAASGLSAQWSQPQPIPGIPADLQQYPGLLPGIYGDQSSRLELGQPNQGASSSRKPSPDSKRSNRRK
jgi:hypothetical protein